MSRRPLRTLLASLGVAAVSAALLSGCTVTAGLTVGPDTVANAAADALEAEVGTRPEVDCGSDAIDLKENQKTLCVLTDPNTGSEFDTTVTLVDVDGKTFGVTVEVASAPN